MNVPKKKEFTDQMKKLKDPQLRTEWRNFYNEVCEHLETEVSVHQMSSVVQLGWEPKNLKKPTQLTRDGKLNGNYVLKVLKAGTADVVKTVIPESDWVEANFRRDVLAGIQNAVIQSLTRVEIISDQGSQNTL